MKLRLLPPAAALGTALVLATFATAAGAQSPAAARIEQRMTAEEFKAAGLDKLTAAELAALDAWMQRQQASIGAPGDADLERIKEQAREEGRREVKEKSRGFFDFGSDEPISSTLVGEFDGFAMGKRYTLANGQVWEQIEPARLVGVRKTDPAVTIKPGVFNVWFLRIAGYGTAAKVRRVK